MPYRSTRELPSSVKDHLPAAAQRQFLHVVNGQLARGLSEAASFASAWSVISRTYHKDPDTGQWVKTHKGWRSPLVLTHAWLGRIAAGRHLSVAWAQTTAPVQKQPTVSQVHVPSTEWELEKRGNHTGLWLGFDLSPQERGALDGLGDPVVIADAHITVAYVPMGAVLPVHSGNDDQDFSQIATAFHALAATLPACTGLLSGMGRFLASPQSDGQDVCVALVDSPGLEPIRQAVCAQLAQLEMPVSTAHGYTPHVSLAFVAPEASCNLDALHDPIPVTIDTLVVRWGAYETRCPLETRQTVHHIIKVDDERQYVFGWASVALTEDGQPLVDHQGDIIATEDLEEMAYQFVLEFREADEMHEGEAIGQLIESCVFTAEKLAQMKLLPTDRSWESMAHWWCGFYISDPDVWAKVKDGTYRMFSIGGEAVREEVA